MISTKPCLAPVIKCYAEAKLSHALTLYTGDSCLGMKASATDFLSASYMNTVSGDISLQPKSVALSLAVFVAASRDVQHFLICV